MDAVHWYDGDEGDPLRVDGPSRPFLRDLRAGLAWGRENDTGVVAECEAALREADLAGLAASRPRLLARKALSLALLDRDDEAATAAERALAQAVDDPITFARIADFNGWFGDPERALELAEAAFEDAIEPTAPLTVSLAESLVRLDRFDEADAILGAARSDDSTEPGVAARRAVVLAVLEIRRDRGGSRTGAARAALRIAEEQAAEARSDRWARVVRLLAALEAAADDGETVLADASGGGGFAIDYGAELIADRLEALGPGWIGLLRVQVSARPRRWRRLLRRTVAEGLPERAAVALHLLDGISEPGDERSVRATGGDRAGPLHDALQALAKRLTPKLAIEDLGRVGLRIGGRPIPSPRPKVLALLCFLVAQPHLSATTDQVVDALWPDADPRAAGGSLNQTIYFLRRMIDPRYMRGRSTNYIVHANGLVWLDPELVAPASHRVRALLQRLELAPSDADVDELLACYTGPFALDFAYEEWADDYRGVLHAAYLERIEREVTRVVRAGRPERAVALARRALDVDPDATALEEGLIRLYRETEAGAAAAEQYGHYAATFRDETGEEPPPLEEV